MRLALLVVIAVVVAACSATGLQGAGPTPTPVVIYADPTEESIAEPTDDPVSPVAAKPAKFVTLNKRGWAQVVKSPDRHVGKGYKLWACISQFDAATGEGSFRGQASFKNQPYWYTDGDNAFFSGEPNALVPFVTGDIVAMNVSGLGSYSYDTQAGGNTTVPAFKVWNIKQAKGSC